MMDTEAGYTPGWVPTQQSRGVRPGSGEMDVAGRGQHTTTTPELLVVRSCTARMKRKNPCKGWAHGCSAI